MSQHSQQHAHEGAVFFGEIMSEDSAHNDKFSALKKDMIRHIAHSKAIFKNEQVDEPDLDVMQKREIASKVLDANPGQFLARFGKYLRKEHLKYFENLKTDAGSYEVDFYLQQAKKALSANHVEVKNRRYAALKNLIKEGNYFSETEMRRRNPLLYEQLVGRHLSEEEQDQINRMDMDSMTLLGLLLEHMDRDAARALQLEQREMEEAAMEESDDDESEDDEETQVELPEEERELLRKEFVTHMYRSFLEGNDKDFDYSNVDQNTDYDNLEVLQQDAEDKYFDSETPESNPCTPQVVSQKSTSSEDELDAYMKTLLQPQGKSGSKSKSGKKNNASQQSRVAKSGTSFPAKVTQSINTDAEPYMSNVRRSHPHVTSPQKPEVKVADPNDEVYCPYVPRSHPHLPHKQEVTRKVGEEGESTYGPHLHQHSMPYKEEVTSKVGEENDVPHHHVLPHKQKITRKVGEDEDMDHSHPHLMPYKEEVTSKVGEENDVPHHHVLPHKQEITRKVGEDEDMDHSHPHLMPYKEEVTSKVGEENDVPHHHVLPHKQEITRKVGEDEDMDHSHPQLIPYKEEVTSKVGEENDVPHHHVLPHKQRVTGKVGEDQEDSPYVPQLHPHLSPYKQEVTGKIGEQDEVYHSCVISHRHEDSGHSEDEIFHSCVMSHAHEVTGKVGEEEEGEAHPSHVLHHKQKVTGKVGEEDENDEDSKYVPEVHTHLKPYKEGVTAKVGEDD